jgi:adenylosuccinate lyase
MPHKLNPKNFEFVKSMWKEFMPRMLTVYMDQITEHQRDLTNSASSRFVTEFMTAFAYSVTRLTSAVKNLGVQERSIRRNFDEASAETLAEPLYILLSLQGHPDGHGHARRLMRKARETGSPLIDLVRAEESLRPYLERLTPDQRRALEHAENYTGLAAERTEAVCDQFEAASQQLLARLEVERRERPHEKLLGA